MKILVDEMPVLPDNCPFSVYYQRLYACKLSVCESLICKNTSDCPYLKVLEEKKDEGSY